MILVAVLALIATAFIIVARLEAKATTNSLRGVQAETACNVGLAAAVYRISATHESCYSLDSAAGWHGYFYDAGGEDLCPDTWVQHYDATQSGRRMTAKVWQLQRVAPGDTSSGNVKKLKRSRGFTSDYYVAVADLDGKLHANPWYINNIFDDVTNRDAKTQLMVGELGLVSNDVRDALALDDKPNWTLGVLRKKLIDKPVPEADYELNETESYFTVYPRVSNLTKADMGRPPVNVNTARRGVLMAILINIPDFDADSRAETVADKLISARTTAPFESRKDMEKALVELGDASVTNLPPGYAVKPGGKLNEKQLNDLLNSLAGTNTANESDFDDPSTHGYYHYNFNGNGDSTERTSDQPSATWGTEVKFTSRFFHVYVLARTVGEDAARTSMSERRMHAVYDATARKLLWKRWHFYTKANMAD